MKGFGTRKCFYTLRIFGAIATFPIQFFVLWEGNQTATDKRAIDVATCIWAIAQYGADCTAYADIAIALGPEFAEQLIAIQKQLDGQQFTGKLRDAKGFLLTVYASAIGLVEGVKEYYPAEHVKRLT